VSGYILSQEARNDLREIKNYIAEDSIEAARRLMREFRQAFRKLSKTSGIGHTRGDLTNRPVLFKLVRSYLIIYRQRIQPSKLSRCSTANEISNEFFESACRGLSCTSCRGWGDRKTGQAGYYAFAASNRTVGPTLPHEQIGFDLGPGMGRTFE
jgi:plasmid stabilization system protein ParE